VAGEIELHHGTSAREFTLVHALLHLPQEQRRIQLIAIRIVEHPSNCPSPHVFDHVRQVVPRFSEDIFRDVRPSADISLYHSVVLEMTQARNEKRSGDSRQSPPQIVETAAAKQQLAHDQQRPTVRKNLACAGNRAVLAISEHARIVSNPQLCI
jgi:hypothetical protein